MARGNTWTNADGLVVGFNTRDTHNVEDSQVHTMGRRKQAELRIDHSTHAGLAGAVAPTSKSLEIPAGSALISSVLVVEEAFTDLTSIVIGTKGSDGVAEDADGINTTILLAALTAGATVEGTGAQLGGDVTDEALYVSLDVTGTAPTAGEAVLHIEYLEPVPSSTPPAPIVGEI